MINKFCCFFLIWCFGLCLSQVNAQRVSEPKEPTAIITPKLNLVINRIGQKFCSKSKMLIRLRLIFNNEGNKPIILYKKSTTVWKYSILGVGNNSSEKPHKIIPFIMDTIKFGELPNRKNFIILKQGESFSFEQDKAIFVNNRDSITDGKIHFGEYSLQITVGTWYYHPNLKDEYRKKWQDEGFLWTKDVTSSPMEFKVEKLNERIIENCSSK